MNAGDRNLYVRQGTTYSQQFNKMFSAAKNQTFQEAQGPQTLVNPVLKKFTKTEAMFGKSNKMASTVVLSPRKAEREGDSKSVMILSGLTNKRVNLPSQVLKNYLQKTNTLDGSTVYTTFNNTLSPRTNNSMILSPKSTIVTQINHQQSQTSTIKKEQEIFRDFKTEILSKIVDPLPEVLETEFDKQVQDNSSVLKTIRKS